MSKSGLSERTSAAIRAYADTYLDNFMLEGRPDKAGLQRFILREMVSDVDVASVIDAIGADKAEHLFGSLQHAIYELVRHKIRNDKIPVKDEQTGEILKIRRFQNVPRSSTTRVVVQTLDMGLEDASRMYRQILKEEQAASRQLDLIGQAVETMEQNPGKFQTLGQALGLHPMAEEPTKIAEQPY